ncbi:uncharacterized protein LOC119189386 [Manduca sexta]|uniref:uncharacterized protein LOC119189386 n=1 Tax=Manduca sexta TaxID=7130 RepID=UPI00188F0D66|nr:uncharacterized protein LOC119189386 [Manduca sexta]
MSQSQEEARAARIQKYKEERRKQLTARTATLFSSNVTERRPKKSTDRTPPEDPATPLKSSSELNLNTASTSMPIRTTRASRLRAAAATQSDTSPSPRKSNRSSSAQSMLDDSKTKSPKSSKIIDRDKKAVTNRRQSSEKENKNTSDREIGAIKTKLKHSINKNILEKDKSNFIVTNPKGRNVDEKFKLDDTRKLISTTNAKKMSVKNEEKRPLLVNGEEDIFDEIEKDLSNSLDNDKIDDLFNNLVVDDAESQNVELRVNDCVLNDQSGLKISYNSFTNPAADQAIVNHVKIDDSVVPKVKEDVGGLLGAVCVRKVERFSELLSNLCSPCEADILFEDILVENGINGDSATRTSAPECTPPCRRAQPSPRTTTPKRSPAQSASTPTDDSAGVAAKPKTRRTQEAAHPKTESSLPSSKVSLKSTFNLSYGTKSTPTKSTTSNTSIHKSQEKRRSIETNSKASCIPLSKKPSDKNIRTSTSPVKQDLAKDVANRADKSKLETPVVELFGEVPRKRRVTLKIIESTEDIELKRIVKVLVKNIIIQRKD